MASSMEEFICGGEERDPECSFDDPDVDLLLLTVALCFFPSHGENINLFFFVSLGEFNMVKRECLWELVGVNSKLYHFFGV